MKRISMKLRTPLQDSEVAKIGNELADKVTELEQVREERAIVYKQYKEKVMGLQEIISEYADRVHNKSFAEDVECEVRPLPGSKRVEIIRLDTGEQVESRAMTDEEKQGEFDWDASPEASAKNAKAFLKKNKRDEGGEDDPAEKAGAFNEESDDETPKGHYDVGDAHPQCGAGGCYLPKLATRHEVELKGLDFTAVVRTIQDSRDGCWHSQWAFGSTVKPVFKGESRANDFEPNFLSYDSEGRAIIGASIAMLDAIKAHDKWTKVASGRALDIIGQIERFQGAQVVTVEEAASAVAAD